MIPLHKILNEMSYHWVTTQTGKARLQRLGVVPAHWPECEAKEWIRKLEASPTPEVVRFDMASWYDTIQNSGLTERLPDDDLELQAEYQRNLQKEAFRDLAQRLTKNPDRGWDMLARFRSDRIQGKGLYHETEVIEMAVNYRDDMIRKGRFMVAIPGFHMLCEAMGGMNPGRVTILGAVTGFGKTTLALNVAHAAKQVMPVVFVNQEMQIQDIGGRAIQVQTHTPNASWAHGSSDMNLKIATAVQSSIESKGLWFTDGRSLTVEDIGAIAFEKLNGDGLLIIDYDQKIATTSGVDEWKALNQAIQSLEEIAKSYSIHVVLLTQTHENGQIKASKRMAQSAATVAVFMPDEDFPDRAFIGFWKARFGDRDLVVNMHYDRKSGRVKENSSEKKKWRVE